MSNARLLWIEDDADLLFRMIVPLKEANYDVKIVKNALEAISILNTENFDLIILDILIPVGDLNKSKSYSQFVGQDLLKQINTNERKIPIIIFSVIGAADLEDLSTYNVKRYILKSQLDPPKLKEEVDSVLKEMIQSK